MMLNLLLLPLLSFRRLIFEVGKRKKARELTTWSAYLAMLLINYVLIGFCMPIVRITNNHASVWVCSLQNRPTIWTTGQTAEPMLNQCSSHCVCACIGDFSTHKWLNARWCNYTCAKMQLFIHLYAYLLWTYPTMYKSNSDKQLWY